MLYTVLATHLAFGMSGVQFFRPTFSDYFWINIFLRKYLGSKILLPLLPSTPNHSVEWPLTLLSKRNAGLRHRHVSSSFLLDMCYFFHFMFIHFFFSTFVFILSCSFFCFIRLISFQNILPSSLSPFLFLLTFQLGLWGRRTGGSPSMYLCILVSPGFSSQNFTPKEKQRNPNCLGN